MGARGQPALGLGRELAELPNLLAGKWTQYFQFGGLGGKDDGDVVTVSIEGLGTLANRVQNLE